MLDPVLKDFLRDAGWADAEVEPVTGDMSQRHYHRARHAIQGTAILMDARDDPSTPAFVRMTELLRKHHFSAPDMLHQDTAQGLLLLEDLGTDSLTTRIARDPSKQGAIYRDVLDLLIGLRAVAAPSLPAPDPADLVAWTRIADATLPIADKDSLEAFRSYLETVLADSLGNTPSLSLRDLHADNLHWLPDRAGLKRIGLLDYQDAFLCHPAYDLVSLLTDARTEVSPIVRAQMVDTYIAISGDDPRTFRRAFAALSVQRNLRILAIFHKNPAKAHLIPRVWTYLDEAMQHPALVPARADLERALPLLARRAR